MAEPPRLSAEPQAATRRGIRWDALAAIVASLVGLLALIVGGYTAYIQREQVRAQVWPYLAVGTSNANGRYEIYAVNKGVGPVIVRSVQITVDGAPVKDWQALFGILGFRPAQKYVQSTLNHIVLAPGDHVRWLQFESAADVDAFVDDWVHFRVTMRVCYASTLGESWMTTYTFTAMPARRSLSSCPRVPSAEQFHD